MTTCPHTNTSLGAYVLGALSPAERAEVEAHLPDCPRCREELAELAPLPGLLSRITLEEALTAPPAPDDALLERLLAAADRDRRGATRRRWLAVAAAIVLLLGGSVVGTAAWRGTHGPTGQSVVADRGPIHMAADVASTASGTRLTLSLGGVPPEERCRLVAVSDTGARDVAGSWVATYTGTATFDSITSIPRNHLARLIVETYDGKRLVSAPVPPVSA